MKWKYHYDDVDGSSILAQADIKDNATLGEVFLGAKRISPTTNELSYIGPDGDYGIMKMAMEDATQVYTIKMNQVLYNEKDVMEKMCIRDRYSMIDNVGMVAALLGVATPNFWLGLMLIIVFSLNLGWLPSGGMGSWKNYIMPAITLGTGDAALICRMTRSSMLEVIRQDYILSLIHIFFDPALLRK